MWMRSRPASQGLSSRRVRSLAGPMITPRSPPPPATAGRPDGFRYRSTHPNRPCRARSMLRGPFGVMPSKGIFPILALKQAPRPHRLSIVIVEATCVDAVILGVGARPVKRMDAAISAECVLRHAGVEYVGA